MQLSTYQIKRVQSGASLNVKLAIPSLSYLLVTAKSSVPIFLYMNAKLTSVAKPSAKRPDVSGVNYCPCVLLPAIR